MRTTRREMAQQRIPDIVLKLQQMAKPSFVNGNWRRGVLSARRLADIRKSLVAEGIYWPPKPLRNRGTDKPFKLNKHERTREERQRRIEENMRQMPQMIADYRKKVEELRTKTRAKKQRTEEQKYRIATGKAQEGPSWEIFKDRTKK